MNFKCMLQCSYVHSKTFPGNLLNLPGNVFHPDLVFIPPSCCGRLVGVQADREIIVSKA